MIVGPLHISDSVSAINHTPKVGEMVYETDTQQLKLWVGDSWHLIERRLKFAWNGDLTKFQFDIPDELIEIPASVSVEDLL